MTSIDQIFGRFMTPARSSRASVERAGARLVSASFDSHADAAIYEQGAGRVVLLVHGWEGWAHQYAMLADELAGRGFHVIAFDAPGHGGSGGVESSIYAFTAVIEDLAAQVQPYAIVAHSFGMLAAALAVKRGVRFSRVVGLAPVADLAYTISRFCELRRLSNMAVREIARRLEERYGPNVWLDGLAVQAADRGMPPALLAYDPTDRYVSLEQSRLLAAAWPKTKTVELPGVGHHGILSDPQALRRVGDFLAEDLATRVDAA